jgi:hypothetical protein
VQAEDGLTSGEQVSTIAPIQNRLLIRPRREVAQDFPAFVLRGEHDDISRAEILRIRNHGGVSTAAPLQDPSIRAGPARWRVLRLWRAFDVDFFGVGDDRVRHPSSQRPDWDRKTFRRTRRARADYLQPIIVRGIQGEIGAPAHL